ncbi:hypothetical protein EMIHUDRAFT_96501 [Emiliania huxleyi CCMP1516]|uniref:C2H2-type domain-containing protein n=2 Tax=Emiliania huxleyi TaxID=2903 RepID=A0A0D3IUA6_EMIH1|nr:hypothetical protein EMIHUDRAFT_96501 [Emiliania huxleyi CCMP1516]EOD14841.1 hypothetical protein EMIHUDRAFT_96501 [Emiliania huxleyi CCMP1516]|eukprot:XP_005767270.1 hypothetical protein EMIHUDRAFT_96501 [Emiliania huxleyi CCMP1516]
MPPKFPKTTGRRKEWRAIGSLPIYELFGCGEFCLAVAVMIASEKSAWSATTRPRRSNAGRVAEHRKVVEKAAKGAGGAKQPAVVGSAVATPEARPHKCNICGGAFKRLGALTEHQRIHTGERPFKCDLCDAAFAQSGHLARHKRTHAKREGEDASRGGASLQLKRAGGAPVRGALAPSKHVPTPAVNGVDFDGRWLYFRVADDIDNFLCVDTQDMAT